MLSLLLSFATLVPQQAPRPKPADPVSVVAITVAADKAPKGRALAHPLLPDVLDQTPGNAAPLWLRAGEAARGVGHLTDKQIAWIDRGTALRDLPREEVRRMLAKYELALHLADQAALRRHCDWDLPPLTMASVRELPLSELGHLRELSRLIGLRARLLLADGKIDEAIRSLRTGFALSRHLTQGDTIVQGLVGIATAGVLLMRLEECLAQPQAPNLYWSLSILPTPFADLLPAARNELSTLHRTVPQLRELEKETLTKAEINRIQDDLIRAIGSATGDPSPAWMKNLGAGAYVALHFPAAKEALLAQGWDAKRLDAMPPQQVVALHSVGRHNRFRDDVIKWWRQPAPDAWTGLEAVEKELKQATTSSNSDVLLVLTMLLTPALTRAHAAQVRTDRQIAALRVVEAIRLHAGAHGGKLPEKLADINAVPLPLDPATGKSFDALYRRDGDNAILEVPPIPRRMSVGWRYEFTPAR